MNIKKIKLLMVFFCIGNELSGLFEGQQTTNPYFPPYHYTDYQETREELENAKKELTEYELKDKELAEREAQIEQELNEMSDLLENFLRKETEPNQNYTDSTDKAEIETIERIKDLEKRLETAEKKMQERIKDAEKTLETAEKR